MSEYQQTENRWLRWWEIMLPVSSFLKDGRLTEVISHLDAFLAVEADPEVRSAALAFRGHINEQLGKFEEAKNNLLTARSLSGPGYQRYVQELGLGSLSEHLDLAEEAHSWYRAALNTCLLDNGTSGGTALSRLLHLCPATNLTEHDVALCRKVVEHSWQVLRLPGAPQLSDLERAASILIEAQGKPIPSG